MVVQSATLIFAYLSYKASNANGFRDQTESLVKDVFAS